MSVQLNQAAIDRLVRGIGEQVRGVVNTTATETAQMNLEHAVNVLYSRLNALDGIQIDHNWCCNALETLRRGDPLTIEIG